MNLPAWQPRAFFYFTFLIYVRKYIRRFPFLPAKNTLTNRSIFHLSREVHAIYFHTKEMNNLTVLDFYFVLYIHIHNNQKKDYLTLNTTL